MVFALGWLLFGWATARAGVLPRTGAYVALVGGLIFGFAPVLAGGNQTVDNARGRLRGAAARPGASPPLTDAVPA